MNYIANHLWQSTWFALVAASLVLVFRKESAQIRFAIWFVASIKFLVPFSLFTAVGGVFSIQADELALLPLVHEVAAPLNAMPIRIEALDASTVYPLSVIWLAGTCFFIWRWLIQWRITPSLLSASASGGSFRSIPIRFSSVATAPALVGIYRPAIVLPDRLITELSPTQVHSICVHEWTHAHRKDNFTAAIQSFVQAIFWFHPLVWWLGSRLLETREQACDEAVIAAVDDPKDYANAVLSVCRLSLEKGSTLAARATGGDLSTRIKDILKAKAPEQMNWWKRALLVVTATMSVAAPVIAGVNVSGRWPTTIDTLPFVEDRQTSAARISLGGPPAFEVHTDRLSIRNMTPRELIAHGYRIDVSEVHTSLRWFDQRFDMDVRLNAPLDLDAQAKQRYAIREALARHFNVQIYLNRRCEQPCGRAGLIERPDQHSRATNLGHQSIHFER
jgi:beta-lactamase regulating signal transducer with metallopeptidase domain